jgi:hypothetical protein
MGSGLHQRLDLTCVVIPVSPNELDDFQNISILQQCTRVVCVAVKIFTKEGINFIDEQDTTSFGFSFFGELV